MVVLVMDYAVFEGLRIILLMDYGGDELGLGFHLGHASYLFK